VGAGPIGITEACLLKGMNKELSIAVLEKRPAPTRNHGLKVDQDSVTKLCEVIDRALQSESLNADKEALKDLRETYSKWRAGGFTRTSEIENQLGSKASALGVKVLRSANYKVSGKDLQMVNSENSEKSRILSEATVIIGADGSHSDVRKEKMGNRMSRDETLQYLMELKYDTDGKTRPRKFIEGSIESSKCGHIDIETTNRNSLDKDKPLTLHVFVDKETYDLFRQTDSEGTIKGVFGNSWTLDEVQALAKTHPKAQNIYDTFRRHLNGVHQRGGTCTKEQVSTLEMRVYCSAESAVSADGKYVVLVGDAHSGMILERGFNKGLKEAAILAEKLNRLFASKKPVTKEIPAELLEYQTEAREIFNNELKWAVPKSKAISASNGILSFLANWIFGPLGKVSSISSSSE
jgi:2-polyprenyl-6-methoxyphenol hydroxylase-like FAD-dependent oxidoreductase